MTHMQPHPFRPISVRCLRLLAPSLTLILLVAGCDHATQQELNQDVSATQQKLAVVQTEASNAAKEVGAYTKSPQFKSLQKKGRDEIADIQKDISLPPAEKKRRIEHVEHETQHEIAILKQKYQAMETVLGSPSPTPASKTG